MTIFPDTTVLDARRMMQEQRVRHVLVMDDGRLAGTVTDRDIRLNLPSPATTLSVWELNHLLARMTVGDVMTKNVITVDAAMDARDAAALLLARKIGALPVLDEGFLVGIVTETDFLRAFVGSTLATA
jgi:acetoin utilization protein AcuB